MASVQIRQLELDDMERAACVHRASFDDRVPWLVGLHTPAEDNWFYRERVFPECLLWGAFEDEILVGIIAFREGWVDQLYILPAAQRRGIGTALLDIAKAQNGTLSLWTFQRNGAARHFYEKHGFTVTKETDGFENEEREPDLLYSLIT